MSKLVILLVCFWLMAAPASALELEAPRVPEAGKAWMPENTDSLSAGVSELLQKAAVALRPDLKEASRVSIGVVCAVLLVSILRTFSGPVSKTARVAGTVAVASLLLSTTDSMIALGSETVRQISEYGKLLLSVMTAAMAAQGGVTASGALYAGTALFDSVLSSVISGVLVPGIWLYLAISAGNSATGEEMLKKLGELLKGAMSFLLKTLLMVFTTYLGLTGVVTGTTDAAALKAAKVTISTVVPVVGGILSDASEAVLVSAGLVRSAAGIYGILAVLALCLDPFLKIGSHYLILKLTAAVCGIFGEKTMTNLIGDFCTAMGLLLAMTGGSCMMTLVSTVCFLRGVG